MSEFKTYVQLCNITWKDQQWQLVTDAEAFKPKTFSVDGEEKETAEAFSFATFPPEYLLGMMFLLPPFEEGENGQEVAVKKRIREILLPHVLQYIACTFFTSIPVNCYQTEFDIAKLDEYMRNLESSKNSYVYIYYLNEANDDDGMKNILYVGKGQDARLFHHIGDSFLKETKSSIHKALKEGNLVLLKVVDKVGYNYALTVESAILQYLAELSDQLCNVQKNISLRYLKGFGPDQVAKFARFHLNKCKETMGDAEKIEKHSEKYSFRYINR